jgi:outer membrane protein OmpA-like peptidoglycan-associated protein
MDVRHDLFWECGNLRSNLEYTVGLTFQLGGTKQVVAAAAPCVMPAAAPVATPVAAPIPAPVPAPAPKVVLIELLDTHFEFDKSSLTPAGKEILVKNIQTLKTNPDLKILVAGYTSASGSEEYNQKLSERRATTVRDALVEGGIAPERLTKIGYGKKRPATFEPYPGDLESKAAKSNMRVLFTIIVQ